MPKKPDKFGVKFWLPMYVETKHILIAAPYLGIDETRASSHMLSTVLP